MELEEYSRLIAGQQLVNTRNHAKEHGMKTNSVGFCFFTDDPDKAIHWLSGCTYPEVCVQLYIPDRLLRESYGIYRDPERDNLKSGPLFGGHRPTMRKTEYCLTQYSLADGVKVLSCTDRYKKYAGLRRYMQTMGLVP